MQGVGNDFVLLDGKINSGLDYSVLAQKVCDRRFGVGADGLLVVELSNTADAFMRMYNPDGTPDVCGNGLRCVARYMWDHWGYKNSETAISLNIETFGNTVEAVVTPNLIGPPTITVNMGTPKFSPHDIPMTVLGNRVFNFPIEIDNNTFRLTALSTGSTHSVIFQDELPTDTDFLAWSREIESYPLFPERTSIMWAKVESEGKIRLRIWERGAGETWGCGTGACAAGIAAILHGFAKEKVTVVSKGGELTISWREGGAVSMTGPAEYVFAGFY